MKRKIYTLAVLLSSGILLSQVGINNTSPQATLDVSAKTTDGSKPEGMIAPRLTGEQIKSGDPQYTTAQKGTIVYATSAVLIPVVGSKTQNITSEGYYYFDGALWQKFTNGNGMTASNGLTLTGNDVQLGGTLIKNTTVAQNTNTMAFTSTATAGTSHFTVDNDTFNVDAFNNRVGIGTNAPLTTLQVLGTETRIGGPSTQSGTISDPMLRIHSNANTDGKGGKIYFNEDNTGYGYYIQHNSNFGPTWGEDALLFGAYGAASHGLTPQHPGLSINRWQNIGIGTNWAITKLHIDSAEDNNVGATPTAAQILNDVVVTTAGSLGLGTISPAQRLHVEGNARITGSTGTPTTITGRNATGDIGNIALGAGLTLSSGTLSAIGGPGGVNLYSSDGTLAGNRLVTQGSNTLNFDGKVIVGSATTANTNQFHIFSGATASDMSSMFGKGLAITTNSSSRIYLENTASTAGQRVFQIKNESGLFSINPLTDDASATLPGAIANAAIGVVNSGYVGIGNSWPVTRLHIDGGADNSQNSAPSAAQTLNDVVVTNTGNLGVGTITPAAKLHVEGTARITGSTSTATAVMGRDTNGDISNITVGTGLALSAGTLSTNAIPISNIVFPFLNVQPSVSGTAYILDSSQAPNYTLWVSGPRASTLCSVQLPDANTMIGRTVNIIAAGGDTMVCSISSITNYNSSTLSVIPNQKRFTLQASGSFGGMWAVITKDF